MFSGYAFDDGRKTYFHVYPVVSTLNIYHNPNDWTDPALHWPFPIRFDRKPLTNDPRAAVSGIHNYSHPHPRPRRIIGLVFNKSHILTFSVVVN